MSEDIPDLTVRFFRTLDGVEPVRDWLKSLPETDRKIIGRRIRCFQFRWPIGMPLVRKFDANLWELRINLPGRALLQ